MCHIPTDFHKERLSREKFERNVQNSFKESKILKVKLKWTCENEERSKSRDSTLKSGTKNPFLETSADVRWKLPV